MASRPLAVVLLSGGMDSCVCLALAARDYEAAVLHFDYGQRTEARERQAFTDMADHYGIERRLAVTTPFFGQIGGSALTDATLAMPESGVDPSRIPITYVPFRNAHFLAAGVSWAEVLGAEVVMIGAVAPDSSGYPDCRPEFYDAFQKLVHVGARNSGVRIEAPLLLRNKSEIVRLGLELHAPFPLSWSCYQNSGRACGRCDSCRLRRRAFCQAGASDPVQYATACETMEEI
ncbi:MAG: 7-cyano-7-deazaguanine synthase QueC [Terriglobales bacterium]